MSVKIPRGRILVRLDSTSQDPELAVGKIVDFGKPPKGPLGDDMGVNMEKGDTVYFNSYGGDLERIAINEEDHVVIDTFQVKLLSDDQKIS